jgi:AcrR family transcriptional regulator
MFVTIKFATNMFAFRSSLGYPGGMAGNKRGERSGRDWEGSAPPDPARLRAEFRMEIERLKEEFKDDWQRALAEGLAGLGDDRGSERRGRGRRNAREPLSRELIVDTAMALMERHGLDKVTMRKIAMSLDTGPASIYVYVRSMAELHGHMLDRILVDIDLDGGDGSWKERVARIIDDYVGLLLDNPDLARSALAARPSGHHFLALVERLLALMDEGGVGIGQRAWGVDLILLWATAGAAEHAERAGDDVPVSEWEALRTAISNSGDYPHIAEIGLDLVGGTPEERGRWAIDALLTGIAGTPRE